MSYMKNCKESDFFVPEGFADTKFKVILTATGKLKDNKWAQIYRIEITGLYVGINKKPT